MIFVLQSSMANVIVSVGISSLSLPNSSKVQASGRIFNVTKIRFSNLLLETLNVGGGRLSSSSAYLLEIRLDQKYRSVTIS